MPRRHMNVCVSLEQRFVRLPDGSVWTRSPFGLPFWQRYLEVFDRVRCLARVRDVARLDGDWQRADGEAVTFESVPYYVGPTQFVRHAADIMSVIHRATQPGEAFVLRVPGTMGALVWRKLQSLGYPYGVEVLGDPFDVFAPGAVRHPLRRFMRWYGTRELQRECRHACAASYVSMQVLERRYPARGPTIAASSIDLGDDWFAPGPRVFKTTAAPVRLLFVGSLEQYYKAPDVLLQALAQNVRLGVNLHLTLVGDGKTRPALEKMARELGCGDRVRFAGHLPSTSDVMTELDAADLFVLPSRTEGLPRAMVEAMARGLPCIGSNVGGIPELLPPTAIVPPADVDALAGRIREIAGDPARMTRMSGGNLIRAKSYRRDVLQPRRAGFYRVIRETTERWLQARETAREARVR